MKLIYALAILALPLSATAAPKANLCGKPLPCGSFAGAFVPADGRVDDKPARETLTVEAGEHANELVISGTLDYPNTGEQEWEYRFLLTFAADRTFTFRDTRFKDKVVMGVGICSDTLCGYTMRPNEELSTSGTFAPEKGGITRTHANHQSDGIVYLGVSRMERI